jgi:hypothetical protein
VFQTRESIKWRAKIILVDEGFRMPGMKRYIQNATFHTARTRPLTQSIGFGSNGKRTRINIRKNPNGMVRAAGMMDLRVNTALKHPEFMQTTMQPRAKYHQLVSKEISLQR